MEFAATRSQLGLYSPSPMQQLYADPTEMLLRGRHTRPKHAGDNVGLSPRIFPGRALNKVRDRSSDPTHKKAPDDAGAFDCVSVRPDQYFATTGPPQLKR